ncbi:TetR/AcrR family transcriptional regulator [Streptodolium elevatio]|uniref:TetR/AcrR family transcriptional regulator n=1 Tax=Streptodolium elevatio TaxID=3157996 RepID=A0ABV3DPB0_9ACTN
MSPSPPRATTDQRLLRGARARWTIARHGADVASAEGLSGLSIGRLATDLGLSKSGVATLFGTKEQLQLAVVEAARKAYVDAVVRPALAHPAGAARLRALVDGWFGYAEQPLFPGGCFWAANLPDFDSRPGPVRDALRAQRGEWLTLLADQIRRAVDDTADDAPTTGAAGELDPELTAFHLDAVFVGTNTALRLGDPNALPRTRRIIENLLAPIT